MTSGEFARRAWWWLTRTFAGRLLLVSLGIKAVVWTVRAATQSMTALERAQLDRRRALLLVALVVVGYRSYVHAKRVVLWRVRRKLTLSYVFIGFVPVLLLVLFFSIAGLLLFVNVGGYLLRARLTTLVDRAQALAQTAAADLAHVRGAAETGAALAAISSGANAQFPLVSYAVVPSSAACTPGTRRRAQARSRWPAPGSTRRRRRSCPEWVSCAGYGSLVAGAGHGVRAPLGGRARRGVGDARRRPRGRGGGRAAGRDAARRDRRRDGRRGADAAALFGASTGPFDDARRTRPSAGAERAAADLILGPANISLGAAGCSRFAVSWAALLDYTAWDTGSPEQLLVQFDLALRSVYEHLSASAGRINDVSIAQLLLFVPGGRRRCCS